MKTEPCVVELADRESDYWESILLPVRPATLLRRLQQMVALLDSPSFRRYRTEMLITSESIMIQFTVGDAGDAELFATLLATALGWQPRHGVLVGRASA